MENAQREQLVHGRLTRGLFMLAGPMFASALLQNAQSLIDLFWVGRLGSAAVAALALSGTVLMMLFPLVMGMATGTVALVSRRIGENAPDAAADVSGQAISLALATGVAAGAVGWVFADTLPAMLGASGEVAHLAAGYLRVSFAGSLTIFVLFIANSALQAAGDAVVPMATMIGANLLNIVLDPVLIFGLFGLPRLGVTGAALATVLAQAGATAAVVAVLARGRAGLRLRPAALRFSPRRAWALLKVGLPGTGQMLARSLMALVLMRIVAAYGTVAMAAYGIGLRFHMILLMPAFALGNAAATIVGQNLGAGRPRRARAAAWLAAGIDVALMAVSAAALWILAPHVVRIFDAGPAVVATGTAYIRVTSGFYVFVALAIVLGRALQGAGDTVAPMITTILALWGLQVPLAMWLPRHCDPPTNGVWWSIAVAVTAHGLLTTGWFLLGRWQRRRV